MSNRPRLPGTVATTLYWGNAGKYLDPKGPAAVGRARLDGTDVDQDWVTGMLGICGLAVDAA